MNKIMASLKQHRFFAEFFHGYVRVQFIKYFLTGISSFVLEISLLYACTEWVNIKYIIVHGFKIQWYLIANSIAYVVVFWFNFLLNKFWSFNVRKNFGRQLTLYFILFVFNFGFNWVMMYVLTEKLHCYYLVSKVFVVGMIIAWNFILYKKVIYK